MTYNSAHHCPASREILFLSAISASQEYSTLIGCCMSVTNSCLIAVLNKYTSRQFYSSQTIIMAPEKWPFQKITSIANKWHCCKNSKRSHLGSISQSNRKVGTSHSE